MLTLVSVFFLKSFMLLSLQGLVNVEGRWGCYFQAVLVFVQCSYLTFHSFTSSYHTLPHLHAPGAWFYFGWAVICQNHCFSLCDMFIFYLS